MRRIRFPRVVDILLVDDPALMVELNDHPSISRLLIKSRWLVNERLRRRIQDHLRTGEQLLPVFTAKENRQRGERQEELRRRFDEAAEAGLPGHDKHVELLGSYVRGRSIHPPMAVVVQEIVGRLFDPAYAASRESYEAAVTVDSWPRMNPARASLTRLRGELGRAKRLIWSLAKDDPHRIHGTAIAMHNIVSALKCMRRIRKRDQSAAAASPEAVARRCVRPPSSLLRMCTSETRVDGVARPLGKGTLVIFQPEKMPPGVVDPDLVFARGQWNECPAAGVVTRLLELVWRKAQEIPAQDSSPGH